MDKKDDVLKTGIIGFDELFADGGIPKGSSVLVAGGPGTGKSILCRQICYNLVSNGKKCMYVSFEESKERIITSMEKFGWDVKKYVSYLIKLNLLLYQRILIQKLLLWTL